MRRHAHAITVVSPTVGTISRGRVHSCRALRAAEGGGAHPAAYRTLIWIGSFGGFLVETSTTSKWLIKSRERLQAGEGFVAFWFCPETPVIMQTQGSREDWRIALAGLLPRSSSRRMGCFRFPSLRRLVALDFFARSLHMGNSRPSTLSLHPPILTYRTVIPHRACPR